MKQAISRFMSLQEWGGIEVSKLQIGIKNKAQRGGTLRYGGTRPSEAEYSGMVEQGPTRRNTTISIVEQADEFEFENV